MADVNPAIDKSLGTKSNDVSPSNVPHLTVNPVAWPGADWDPEPSWRGQPFVFDRGTQTIHLAPDGYLHGDIHSLVDHSVGPIFNGYIDGGHVQWYGQPNRGEREAVTGSLAKYTGKPLINHGDTDEPAEFKIGKPHNRPIQCSTCGDILDGADCPRCDWGGWDQSQNTTDNPSDPTTPLKGDFMPRAKVGHLPVNLRELTRRWFW